MNEESLISKAMAVLGRRTSKRKTEAARENAARPRPNARKKKSSVGGGGVGGRKRVAAKRRKAPNAKLCNSPEAARSQGEEFAADIARGREGCAPRWQSIHCTGAGKFEDSPNPRKRSMTLRELGERLGKSERTIRRWCERGLIHGARRPKKKGGHWRVGFVLVSAATFTRNRKRIAKFARNRRGIKTMLQSMTERALFP